jgi:predicted RNA-binding protein with PIN domain
VTYIVDGNNVMAQRVGWHKDKAGARRRLIHELEQFASVTGEPVVVVFDGPPDPAYPEGTTVGGVLVLNSGRESDADTRIRELIAPAPEPDALTVVTSDRRLADDIRRMGALVIRSGALRHTLDALSEGGDPTQHTHLAPSAHRAYRRRSPTPVHGRRREQP